MKIDSSVTKHNQIKLSIGVDNIIIKIENTKTICIFIILYKDFYVF